METCANEHNMDRFAEFVVGGEQKIKKTRSLQLDGLRGIAVLLVLFF